MTYKIVNTCTAPDGTVFKRVSNSGRTYSYALIGKKGDKWFSYSWHSREDLARKEAIRWLTVDQVATIVPVTAEVKQVAEKKAVDYPDDIFELEGISFARKDKVQAVGWYRGMKIVVRKYKSSFGASAYSMSPSEVTGKLVYDCRTNLHTSGHGKLERQVKQIKDLVDNKFRKEAN